MIKVKQTVDYPLYNGQPYFMPIGKWVVILASIVLGVLPMLVDIPFMSLEVQSKIGPFLFTLLPLIGLVWATKGKLGILFKKPKVSHVLYGILFFIINLIVTMAVGMLLKSLGAPLTDNAVLGHGNTLSIGEKLWTMFVSGFQLIGEELFTILPFLAIMQLCFMGLKMSRKASVLIALIVTALIFGALHLPTYHFNFTQAILGIGIARVILTLAYMKTKNIWTSIIAHILNDWAIFGMGMLGSAAAAPFLMHFLH
ncbi:type II CAAX endopeptidase family protein [Paenibacillus sp. FSL K6-0276]|uniref:CPBP family intramembrane glutamic endopeptidase n=1 Tax=Paenibacillus sp. FSL K6-0276 TaxID=2921450 RepID=UPI0030EE9A43